MVHHHLVDPATGRSAETRWEAVTASGATCVAADIAARVGFLAGAAGSDRLDRWGIPGRFVALDGAIVVNNAWATMVREPVCT